MPEYKEFVLTIHTKDAAGNYPLSARSPEGDAEGSMKLTAEDHAMNALLEGGQPPLQEIGAMLFQRLFPEKIRKLYDMSVKNDYSLRIRLIVHPPELVWLHWEFLYHAEKESVLGISPHTVLVRHIPLDEKIAPLAATLPLRILVFISSPSDLPPLNVALEKDLIRERMAELVQAGTVEIDILEGSRMTSSTRAGIAENTYKRRMTTSLGLLEILRPKRYHIFHFIGHGSFNEQSGFGSLAFEHEETGKAVAVEASVLKSLFADHQVRLVVLNGCETAVASERFPLLGVAPALARGGVPAVVAMQFPITDKAAIIFSRIFYGELAAGQPVDAAVTQARLGIYTQFKDRRDWGTPVVFMRSPDGMLWDMAALQTSSSTKAATPAPDANAMLEGRRWACLIGANDYDDPAFPPIAHPEANVDAFTRILEDKRLGDFDQVVALKGKTHTEIIREIKRISGQLKVADLLLIYVSGYALLDKEETGKLYLIAQGTDPTDLPGSAIDLGRVKSFLDKSEARQKILILDCQYGGQSFAAPAPDPGLLRAQLQLESNGKYLISSPVESGAPAKSAGTEDARSPLTAALLDGILTGKADLDQSGKITVNEWFTYAQRQFSDRRLPAPLKWDDGAAGNWVVARAITASGQESKPLPTSLKRNYKYISEMFRDGSIIPFLGSEMALELVAPPDADGKTAVFSDPPLERELAQRMAGQAELLQDAGCNPLTVISQYYQMHVVGARPLFYRQLKKLFPQQLRPGRVHRFLAQQAKPMLVITASYDTLLEQVFREQGKPFAVVTHVAYAEDEGNLGKVVVQYSDRPESAEIGLSDELSIDLDRWWVFYKIQGTFDLFIKGLGGKEEVDSIVISEEDYIARFSRSSDQHRTLPTLFHRLFQQRQLLFLGYRMCDWNFRSLVHILRKDEKIRKVKGYAVRDNPPDFERFYWESMNVQLIECTASEFIHGLAAEMGLDV